MPSTIIIPGDLSAGSSFASGNDGTLILQSGLAGAKVNALAVAADGTPTYLKQPVLPIQSMVRVNTANGLGSTNTAIRAFNSVVVNQGSDITLSTNAAAAASFTINTAGVYAISYTDAFNAAGNLGVSLNSSQLTTNINNINAVDRLCVATTAAADYTATASTTLYLLVGSVIRPHAAAGSVASSNPASTQFTITRVA